MNIRYQTINSHFYKKNRIKFAKKMKAGSIAVFHSNPEMHRNGDCSYPFRQDSDFFYLTGIDQEQSTLILFPDHQYKKYQELLFIRKTDEHIKIWEGKKYTKKEATTTSGINSIAWNKDLKKTLQKLFKQTDTVYLKYSDENIENGIPTYNDLLKLDLEKSKLKIKNTNKIFSNLRVIKSAEEIAVIKHACSITHKAFTRVLEFMKPNCMEYEVEAEITHEFIRNGANGHAYSPIVASGKNACVLHYIDNNNKCKDGDLVLMDFGAEYGNYASDLTRTIPVNGKFTTRQKEVYNAVLNVMKFAKSILAPGVIIKDYQDKVGEKMTQELLKLKLLSTAETSDKEHGENAYKRYFMHGTSHFMGLDVHDVGDRSKPLKAGMVVTCEPGIYIPEEKIGVRIENDILITKDGNIDLMADIPIEVEEIEELMKSKSNE